MTKQVAPLLFAILTSATTAQAQTYPTKTVTMVVTAAAAQGFGQPRKDEEETKPTSTNA